MSEKFFLPATILICALMFVVLQQFFYEPAQREILSMQLETRRLRELEREISELKRRHKNLSALVAVKEQELDDARNFLPATLEQDKFFDELYRAADFCGTQIATVQAGEIISTDETQSQVVTVKLEADYVSLLKFIREIIDGARLASLERFSVESSGGKILSCTLTFKIFAEVQSSPRT